MSVAEALPRRPSVYVPQGRVVSLWDCRGVDEVMVSGPAGTGKSRAILEYLYALCGLHPGIRVLIARATRASLTESALVTFEQHVVPRGHAWVKNQIRRVRQSYELPNGSEIVVGGLDNTARIMSTEFDVVYVQEAREIEEAAWEDLSSRLRNNRLPWQQIIGDTNPDGPTHWIKTREQSGKLTVIESRHEDNPVLYDEAAGDLTEAGRIYLGRLDNLTGVRRDRLRWGRWVGAEGMVWDTFDPAVHVVEPFKVPDHWPRDLSVDFGFTNAFCCQWWAEDPDGRLYRYRELYGTNRLVREWAHLICWYGQHDPKVRSIITDHDSESRADLEAHMGHRADECPDLEGKRERWVAPTISTTPAIKDVKDGIQAVMARLARAGDGWPRLYLVKGALVERDQRLVDAKVPTCTEEEIPRYVWAKARSLTAGEVTLEEPVKRFDHGCDALRYRVMAADAHLAPGERMAGKSMGERIG